MADETIFFTRKHCARNKELPRFLTCMLLLLLFSRPVIAGVARIEGRASIHIVFASPEIVICYKCVSDQKAPRMFALELFGLDPKDKRVIWRKAGVYSITRAVADQAGNFLSIEYPDTLVCRNLRTGAIVWKRKLSTIRPEESAWQQEYQRFVSRAGKKPDEYKYKGPFVTHSGIVIFREAREGIGCMQPLLFNDWLLFDLKKGVLLRKGGGEYIGAAGHSFLVKKPQMHTPTILEDEENGEVLPKKRLSILEDVGHGQITLISKTTRCAFDCDRMDYFYFDSHDVQYSCQGRCVIEMTLSDANPDQEGYLLSKVAIFDANSRKFTYLSPTNRPKYQTDWVLLPNCIVRYSGIAYDYERKKLPHWIEVYDLKGKLLSRKELLKPVSNEDLWLHFTGTTCDGNVLFLKGNRLRVFEVPSLRVIAEHDLGKPPQVNGWPSRDFFVTRRSNVFYEVLGNAFFGKMKTDKISHEIYVGLIDCRSGNRIWRNSEKVVIRKIGP